QLLTESLVLGMIGAAAGVGVAVFLVRLVVLLGPARLPHLSGLAMDAHVLAFALGAAVFTSVAFGLAPAVSVARRRSFALSSRGAVGNSSTTTRRVLVISELALAAMLL